MTVLVGEHRGKSGKLLNLEIDKYEAEIEVGGVVIMLPYEAISKSSES